MTTTDPTRGRHEVAARRVTGAPAADDFTYSVVEPDPRERRGERRARTRLRDGLVKERRGQVLVECRIRDRSRFGARLRLDADLRLPNLFILTDAASRARYRAVLVWQVGLDAGVRLVPLADD